MTNCYCVLKSLSQLWLSACSWGSVSTQTVVYGPCNRFFVGRSEPVGTQSLALDWQFFGEKAVGLKFHPNPPMTRRSSHEAHHNLLSRTFTCHQSGWASCKFWLLLGPQDQSTEFPESQPYPSRVLISNTSRESHFGITNICTRLWAASFCLPLCSEWFS